MKKEVNAILNKEWSSAIIPLCRLLKAHSTNILLLPNNFIMIQPLMSGIRSYMIVNHKYNYSHFVGTHILTQEISKVNTKFKKTKSIIDWTLKDDMDYVQIINDNEDPYEIPTFTRDSVIDQLIEANYNKVPDWSNTREYKGVQETKESLLYDEGDNQYFHLTDFFIPDMIDKKLCTLTVHGYPILVSKPLLGDLKKTHWVGYRVVNENDTSITLKFKQKEDLGNIYTYAAFLKI